MQLDFQTLSAFFQTNWGWAAGLAASMSALTLLAGLLAKPLKDNIALWLMGTHEERSWARSFIALFDSVFGVRHLSLTCFLRSAIASLIAVTLIWLLMGEAGAIGIRLEKEFSLGAVLILALAVNVLADYISLLETRWLLGLMPRIRSWWAQALVLAADLVISAAIIWLAILAYVHTPFHEGEINSFAEILGVFSIFSVLFYSTFLTSVWTWGYILSTWVLRLVKRLRLAEWLDVEGQPVRILSLVTGAVTFAGALAASVPLAKDAEGLSAADRALCTVFKGEVCLSVAGLTEAERTKLDLVLPTLSACDGLFMEQCVNLGFPQAGVGRRAAAEMADLACGAGDAYACAMLGFMYEHGLGVGQGVGKASLLYRRSCDAGHSAGCTRLALLRAAGGAVGQDLAYVLRLLERSCDRNHAPACAGLGRHYEKGIGVGKDREVALSYYERACGRGYGPSCRSLAQLMFRGPPDPAVVAREREFTRALLRRACAMGNADACEHVEPLGTPAGDTAPAR
ncbi:MAG: tetratricopeptide repeat protein [Pseudomonadota bacterium]